MAETSFQKSEEYLAQILKTLKGSQGASPAEQKKLEQTKVETAKNLSDAAKSQKKQNEEFGGSVREYLAKTEENQITWGGLGNAMKKGVTDWFEKASKQQTMLGTTLRFASFVAKSWQMAAQQFSKVFSTIGGHVREVLGPVASAFDTAKEALMGTFNFIKGTISHFRAQTPPADKRRNKLLQGIVKELTKQRKGAFTEGLGKKDKKGMPGMLTLLLATLGAVIGGVVAAILMPFTLLLKVLRTIGIVATKIPKVGQIFSWFGKLFGFIGKIGKGVAWLLSKIPIVRTLFAGFKVGFKFLGWPIQIIFLLIDFIKGFQEKYGTSGSIIQAIGAGLKSAFLGFLELPVKLIGWLIDKVLAMFGVESAGSAGKIMGFLGKAFDMYWGYIKWIFNTIGVFFKLIAKLLGPVVKWAMDKITPILKLLVEAGKWFVDTLWGKIKKVLGFFGWKGGGEEEEKHPLKKGNQADIDAEMERQRRAKVEAEKKKAEAEAKARAEQERIAKEQLEAQRQAANNAAMAVGGQGGPGAEGGEMLPQIPDEVDNWGMTSKNYDMEAMS